MNKRIIYRNDDGGVSVIIPSPDCGLTVDQIAKKDVPTGKKYKIVDASELPDRDTRAGWEVSESYLTDGVGQ